MGFASVDSIFNAVTINDRMQHLWFNKRFAASVVGNGFGSWWPGTGNPGVGETPTVGMAGAVTCNSSTAGAMPFTNASGGRTMHLLSLDGVLASGGVASFMLVDRLAHANIDNSQATAAFSPVIDGTARLASGEGAMLIQEVTTALGTGTNVRNFTYTNQDGSPSQVTQNITTVASLNAGNLAASVFCWAPLAAGDSGVRSVEATTLVSGTQTGAVNVALVKPLTPWLTLFTNGVVTERDFVLDVPMLPRIRDNACLHMLYLQAVTGTPGFHGELRIAEN